MVLAASLSERTLLLQKEWTDVPLPVPIYRRVTEKFTGLRIPDRILMAIAPQENSLLWIIINASQVLLSFFLLMAFFKTMGSSSSNSSDGDGDGDSTDSYEQQEEIIATHVLARFDDYNLITISIWIVEVGTSLWLSSRNRDRLTYAQCIELCFALVFACHSIYFVLPHHDHRSVRRIMLLNVCVKMVAYSYAFFQVLQRFRHWEDISFREGVWWEDISMGGTSGATMDTRSQCSNAMAMADSKDKDKDKHECISKKWDMIMDV